MVASIEFWREKLGAPKDEQKHAEHGRLGGLQMRAAPTFISAREGGEILLSSTLISPSGIWLMHWSMMRSDCLISSTLHPTTCMRTNENNHKHPPRQTPSFRQGRRTPPNQPAEVTVVAVAAGADGDVKLDLVVGVVRLRLAQVPLVARAARHDAGKAPVLGLLRRHHTNIHQTLLPDAVARQQLEWAGEGGG